MQQVLRIGDDVVFTTKSAFKHGGEFYKDFYLRQQWKIVGYRYDIFQYDRNYVGRELPKSIRGEKIAVECTSENSQHLHECGGLTRPGRGRWVRIDEIEPASFDDGVDNWL